MIYRKKIATLLLLVPFAWMTSCSTSIPNAVTKKVRVYGNCGMCEETIEKAARKEGVSEADWDVNTKIATITFDSMRTDLPAILKRIAASGYDNEQFTAPDKAYSDLHTCCKYERKRQ